MNKILLPVGLHSGKKQATTRKLAPTQLLPLIHLLVSRLIPRPHVTPHDPIIHGLQATTKNINTTVNYIMQIFLSKYGLIHTLLISKFSFNSDKKFSNCISTCRHSYFSSTVLYNRSAKMAYVHNILHWLPILRLNLQRLALSFAL